MGGGVGDKPDTAQSSLSHKYQALSGPTLGTRHSRIHFKKKKKGMLRKRGEMLSTAKTKNGSVR